MARFSDLFGTVSTEPVAGLQPTAGGAPIEPTDTHDEVSAALAALVTPSGTGSVASAPSDPQAAGQPAPDPTRALANAFGTIAVTEELGADALSTTPGDAAIVDDLLPQWSPKGRRR